jgi:hypothetical protein
MRQPEQQENSAPAPAVLPDPRPLERLEAVTRKFAQELVQAPKELRTAFCASCARALPLRRCRPNDPRIDAAVRMFEQGRTVKETLRLQISGFDKLDTYGHYLAEKGLRMSIARRRKSFCKTSSHS